MASDELTPVQREDRDLALLAEQALTEQLAQLLAMLPAEEADQIRAGLAADKAAEEDRVLAEERAIAAQTLSPAEREYQAQLLPRPGEDPADWRDRMIELHGGSMPFVVPGGSDPRGPVSIDLGTQPRRKRERLMRVRPDRPNQLRRHVLRLLRPPVCHGARPRTSPRPRGRRARRAAGRGGTRGSPSGRSEPPGLAAGRRCDDVESARARRWSAR